MIPGSVNLPHSEIPQALDLSRYFLSQPELYLDRTISERTLPFRDDFLQKFGFPQLSAADQRIIVTCRFLLRVVKQKESPLLKPGLEGEWVLPMQCFQREVSAISTFIGTYTVLFLTAFLKQFLRVRVERNWFPPVYIYSIVGETSFFHPKHIETNFWKPVKKSPCIYTLILIFRSARTLCTTMSSVRPTTRTKNLNHLNCLINHLGIHQTLYSKPNYSDYYYKTQIS